MFVLHAAGVTVAQRAAIGALAATAIALAGHRLRWLTASGAIAAVVIGAVAFAFGGLLVAAAIVLFFVSGSLLVLVRTPAVGEARSRQPKDARRDAAQVVANGGIATACAIVGAFAGASGWPSASRWMVAAVCALAAVCGDTWSTEIGALSRGPVRLATSMQRVAAGTSGGITPLGTIAAPIGGALVGLAGAARPDLLAVPAWLTFGALAGLVGSAFDSVLGASVQGMWRCSQCGQPAESPPHGACGSPAILVRGFAWLDNDAVNGLASLCGAALGFALGGPTL